MFKIIIVSLIIFIALSSLTDSGNTRELISIAIYEFGNTDEEKKALKEKKLAEEKRKFYAEATAKIRAINKEAGLE